MKRFFLIIIIATCSMIINAQEIDKIIAIIGDEIVLRSEVENQYLQYISQGVTSNEELRCEILEDLMTQKLLIFSCKQDSISVTKEEIEQEVETRVNYYVDQIGSIEKVEQYFEKDIYQIKKVLSELVEDQFLIQRMQSSITKDVKITPFDVNEFYEKMDKSELPLIEDRYKLSQIIVKPKMSEDQINKLTDRLNAFRKRVLNGEDFKVLAALYSDDPGSANNGGEIGFVSRGTFVPEFEKVAFRLKKGEVSEIVKTNFGYHIIQLIERRGDQVNVRHILLKPKYSSTSLQNARLRIDSIYNKIKNNEISFSQAIKSYSDDDTKNNNGLLINPSNGSSTYTIAELGSSIKYLIEGLNEDDFTKPVKVESNEGSIYRILNVVEKISSHTANLDLDYDFFQTQALNFKKQEKLDEWIEKRIKNTYVELKEIDKNCKSSYKW
jgi:peptidyl-prolyl cis-trans isomerase SurA|tara:strand:- start:5909 stop:7225 length:1317 start_codon:yes stop_codon:yes gene_type:complete